MSDARPSRVTTSQARVLERLRLASRRGDRTALALAVDDMRTLAFTPRHWRRYLALIRHPLARLVDLLVIKQGDRIAQQKGWATPSSPPRARRRSGATGRKAARPKAPPAARSRRARGAADQPTLFPGL